MHLRPKKSYSWPTKEGPRPPLRNFDECAELLGVDRNKLLALMRDQNAPAPELRHVSATMPSHRWYRVDKMRAWFNSLPKDAK